MPKSENVKRRFTAESFAFDRIDVRENNIKVVLGKIVKRRSFGYYVPKAGVIFLDMRLLAGLIGVAKEQQGFAVIFGVVLNGKDVSKFAAVIGDDNGENIAERLARLTQPRFEVVNFVGNFHRGFVIEQEAEHKITGNKVERKHGFAAYSSDEGIHFPPRDKVVVLLMRAKVLKGSADSKPFGNIFLSLFRTGLKFNQARQVNGGNGKIVLMEMPVSGRNGNVEFVGLQNMKEVLSVFNAARYDAVNLVKVLFVKGNTLAGRGKDFFVSVLRGFGAINMLIKSASRAHL